MEDSDENFENLAHYMHCRMAREAASEVYQKMCLIVDGVFEGTEDVRAKGHILELQRWLDLKSAEAYDKLIKHVPGEPYK